MKTLKHGLNVTGMRNEYMRVSSTVPCWRMN